MNTPYIWVNGSFVPADQAILKAGDLAVHRGYGVFDFFKFIDNAPILWDHYLHRFSDSVQGLGLNLEYAVEDLKEIIKRLIHKNQQASGGIKLTLTGGYSLDGYSPHRPNLIITQHKIEPPSDIKYAAGIKVITHCYQRELPEIKTINYLQGIHLLPKLHRLRADDVLYHNHGLVTEFPRSNFFMVDRQGDLLTPARNVLPGITRRSVCSISPAPVHEQELSLDMVMDASEAFQTSTTKGILPVVEIDGHKIATGRPGPLTRQLGKAIDALHSQKLSALTAGD